MLKTVVTDTLEIAFEEAGAPSGGPVILLHGFPDDAKAWAAVARGLSDAGFYTIAPYLRGFGKTRFRRAETPRSSSSNRSEDLQKNFLQKVTKATKG
jgi:pimeloyl-ACP methyl ester carboxylesterase